jgi:hypothetical protein
MQFHPCPCFGGQFQGVTAITLRFFGPLNPPPSRSKGLVSSDSSQFSFGGGNVLVTVFTYFRRKKCAFLGNQWYDKFIHTMEYIQVF